MRVARDEWLLWRYAPDRTVSLLHFFCPVHSVFIRWDLETMVQAEGWQLQGSKAETAWGVSHRHCVTSQRALEWLVRKGWGYLQ